MEKNRLQNSRVVPEYPDDEPTGGIDFKGAFLGIAGLLVTIVGVGVFIEIFNWASQDIKTHATLILGVVAGLGVVAVLSLLAGKYYQMVKEEARKDIQVRTLKPTPQNAYPVLIARDQRTIIQPVNGDLPNVQPHTYSPSIHNHNDVNQMTKLWELARREAPMQIAGPAAGDLPKPTIDEIVSHVRRNAYEIVLGRSLTNREFIMIELLDAHIKLIGGSRMGKSCEAGAIIDQARQSHDNAHLLLAILDLENKTGRLFENDPHILTISTGYKKVKMHARNVEQVAQYLILLHELMCHRYDLTDAEVEAAPHVLIYLEEFLYWKKLLGQFVTPEIKEQALAAFVGIATRGLKVGLHLMACAQVDYADDDLKDAMAQFLAVNVAFCVKPSAAQAAGFVANDLLKRNYEARVKGQFVVEAIGGSDIGIAPDYDVKAKLAAMSRTVEAGTPEQAGYKTLVSEVPEDTFAQPSESQPKASRNQPRNETDPALQARVAQVMQNPGESQVDIIKRVWGATPGDNAKYKQAKQEYIQIMEIIHAMARRGMDSYQDSEMEE